MKPRIALLYGGASKEHDVSVMGYDYVSKLLDTEKYEILPVYIERSGRWSVTIKNRSVTAHPTSNMGGSLYTVYGFIKIDAAIPLLHGDGGEDGSIQGMLECCGIKYVGASVAASAVCIDKVYTKAIAEYIGIPTLRHVAFSSPTDTDEALSLCIQRIGIPMFVKPRCLGSSVGAFPIYSADDFKKHFPASMNDGGNYVMVEPMLKNKRELECAFCEIGGKRVITPPAEVRSNGFYSYGDKYSRDTPTDEEADIPDDVKDKVIGYSRLLADAVGLRHLGRIDFFLSEGRVYFNEINTFPGFTNNSLYPKMLMYSGIDPKAALDGFLEDAIGGRTL